MGKLYRASEELRVAHSAVSPQIRPLEESVGRTLFLRQGRLMFDDPMHLLETAATNQGITLARSCLVHYHLASGRLVRLFAVGSQFDIQAPARGAYFAVWPRNSAKIASLILLRAWLHQIIGNAHAGAAPTDIVRL